MEKHHLLKIKDYLVSIGKWEENVTNANLKKRAEGYTFTDKEHLQNLIYAFLTAQRPWKPIVPHLSEIDEIFCNYDFAEIKKQDYHKFLDDILAIKCGNRQLAAQMKALHGNIRTLETIIRDYGSLDSFIMSDRPDIIVKKLTDSGSEYKIKQLGESLAMEYLKNIGIDVVKPDVHLRRFLGKARMGADTKNDVASVPEVLAQVDKLAEETGLTRIEIDSLIWLFCSSGNGEICAASPRCDECVISEHCHNSKCSHKRLSPMNGKLRNMTSIYISQNNKMLLLYRIGSRVVEPSWCGIGGHFEKDELNDARACVLRELYEELNVPLQNLENLQLRYIILRLKNGEIRQNYYFFADLKQGAEIELLCDEGKPEWVAYDEVPAKEMPFTAKAVLKHYLEKGINTACVYGGSATEKGVCFTELEEF